MIAMVDVEALLQAANAVNSTVNNIKKVGNVIDSLDEAVRGNGHKGMPAHTRTVARGKRNLADDTDFSDLYEETPRRTRMASKAPACYQATLEHMAELGRLQNSVDYQTKLRTSAALKTVEQAKAVVYAATSQGFLKVFHRLIPEPVPALETLVSKEISVMASMHKQVGMAVNHSEGIVGKLRKYDAELMNEFDSAKTRLMEEEEKLAKIQKAVETKTVQLGRTQMDNPEYVPLQTKLNNTLRAEKETKNGLEILGQEFVDTYKQSSQVRAKEDVVRMGLHELRLVHSYATRFLTFVQRTRQADDLLPQLVETATAVTDAYRILTGIVQAGNVATTDAVRRLVEVIGTVDYTMLPTVQREVNKQRSMLEKADKRTTFYEQAVELLRGKNYQPANNQEQPGAQAPPAAA